jgi:gluconate:H+ symporter, GntP family
MGLMILGGCVVGAITAACGWAFAHWLERKPDLPLRATAQTSLEDLDQFSKRSDKDLPPFWLAILPILLPVALISASAFVEKSSVIATVGNANVALALSVLVGLATLGWQRRSLTAAFKGGVLAEAAGIILITSAGGAFGGTLQQSGIAARIQELTLAYSLPMIPLAWGLTALLRTAQGSATVAMITSVGVLSGMATPEALGFHPLWLALAIGCGSKMIPWMNDSGFWVITKMSGFTEKECLTTFSPMVTLMGIVGLLVVMLLAKLFPLV